MFSHAWLLPYVIALLPWQSIDCVESRGAELLNDGDDWSPVGPPIVESSSRCQPIDVAMCQSLDSGYTHTALPNAFGDQTQIEATVTLSFYKDIIGSTCSRHLSLFICLSVLPVCTNGGVNSVNIVPCRHYCRHVTSQCSSLIGQDFDDFYQLLACDKYPAGGVCFNPIPKTAGEEKSGLLYRVYPPTTSRIACVCCTVQSVHSAG